MITSLAGTNSEEHLNDMQELRGRGLSICTDDCNNNDAYLFSLLGQDVMG